MYTIPAAQQQYISRQLPPGVVLNSPGIGGNGQQIAEDASRKREMRLMKNRWVCNSSPSPVAPQLSFYYCYINVKVPKTAYDY